MMEKLILLFLVAFFTSVFSAKFFIKKAKKKGFVARDMYKENKPFVPFMGGFIILAGIFSSLIVSIFLKFNHSNLFILYFVVFAFALYGLADDLFGFKKKSDKILLLFFLALPIAVLTIDTNLNLIFFNIELGWIYGFLFAPIYIMVVVNMINMHSGYNGLAGGLTLILLIFAAIKSYMINGFDYFYFIMPVIGALTAFMYFNWYPSKVFLGNIGSFLIGSALGGFLVLSNMEFFGAVILIPHISDFLLFSYTKITRKKFVKFGGLRKDRTLIAPNPPLKLKALIAHFLRVNEWKAVLILYSITIIFCIIGLIWF
ncbi:hypothetical protein KKH26_01530 [Patescibacteria group bacterium]|nr:hypothetical protein [Patescibacteria group bacterium]